MERIDMKNAPSHEKALIREPAELAPTPPRATAPKRQDDDHRTTACGLTREELRAIVAEIIG